MRLVGKQESGGNIMRMLNETVSQRLMGDDYRYFVYFCGDEFLLEATNDKDAIVEGAALREEPRQENA